MSVGADPELGPPELALKELGERSARLRTRVGVVFVGLGLVFGGWVYLWVEALAADDTGAKLTVVIAAAAASAGFALAVAIGWLVARKLVRLRAGRWVSELARQHGVDPKELAESAEIFQ